MPKYYPVMLDVRGRKALVIGGDAVAAEKAASLSLSGAQVTVQCDTFAPEVLALHEQQKITLHKKAYAPGDLAGAFVVVATSTHDPALTEAIWQETQQRGQLVNIVDVPARCNYIVPSILRRGQLTIAVSTEGASPSIAKRVRQQLEGLFPSAYDAYLQLASAARALLREANVPYDRRDAFFGEYFTSEVLTLLSDGEHQQATTITVDLLCKYTVSVTAGDLLALWKKEV